MPLYFGGWFTQTKYVVYVMMTKEGSTKIVNFMTPGEGGFLLGRGHISHCSEYICIIFSSFNTHVYSSLVAFVLRD